MGITADDEIARHQIHLFPVVVDEWRGGIDAGIKPQQARPAPHLPGFVEIARKNLLLDSRWIADRCVPPLVHVDWMKFEMRFVHWHGASPLTLLPRPARAGCRPNTAGRSRARKRALV